MNIFYRFSHIWEKYGNNIKVFSFVIYYVTLTVATKLCSAWIKYKWSVYPIALLMLYMLDCLLTDRNDTSSFSRSRSSSMSSLDNVSKEAIQSLVFCDSYTGKTGTAVQICPVNLSLVIFAVIFMYCKRRNNYYLYM